MDEEDLGALRKELLALNLIQESATDTEVRRVGERMGSWAAASAKRQRFQKKA